MQASSLTTKQVGSIRLAANKIRIARIALVWMTIDSRKPAFTVDLTSFTRQSKPQKRGKDKGSGISHWPRQIIQ